MPQRISILMDSGETPLNLAELKHLSILTDSGEIPLNPEEGNRISILTDTGEIPVKLADSEDAPFQGVALDDDPFAHLFSSVLTDQLDATEPAVAPLSTTQPSSTGNDELMHDAPNPLATQPATQPVHPPIPIPPLPHGANQHDTAIRNIQYAIDLLKANQTYSQEGAALQHLLDTNSIQLSDLGYAQGGFVMGFTPRPYFSAANTIQIDITYAAQADPHNIIGIATLAGTLVHELAHLESYTAHGTIGNFFSKFGEGLALITPEGHDKDGDFRSRGEYYYTNLGIDVRNAIVLDLKKDRPDRH